MSELERDPLLADAVLEALRDVPPPKASDESAAAAAASALRGRVAAADLALFGFVRVWSAVFAVFALIAAVFLAGTSAANTSPASIGRTEN